MANKHPFCQHQMLPLALCKGIPLKQQLVLRSCSTPRRGITTAKISDLIKPVHLKSARSCTSLSSKPCSTTTIKYQHLLYPTRCPTFLRIFFSHHNSMEYSDIQKSMLKTSLQRTQNGTPLSYVDDMQIVSVLDLGIFDCGMWEWLPSEIKHSTL